MSIADRIEAVHDEAMKDHAREIKSHRRMVIGYSIFCAVVLASSAILIWLPPPGFAPPAGFTFSGQFAFQALLLASAVIGFTVLLAYASVLMSRQTNFAKDLVEVIFVLMDEIGSNRSDNTTE